MKLATLWLRLVVGIVSLGGPTFSMEMTPRDPSTEEPSTRKVSQTTMDYDFEREKFCEIHLGSPPPSHRSITTTLQNNMATCSKREAETDEECYVKYFLLKSSTAYALPESSFKDGYLYSPKQVILSLTELGFDANFVHEVNKSKFWVFSVKHLELPDPKLYNNDESLTSYVSELDKLIDRFEMRIKENAFALLGFLPFRDNVSSEIGIFDESGDMLDFINSSFFGKEDTINKKSSIIQEIVNKRKYDTDGLDAFLVTFSPLSIFGRLCKILADGKVKSWHCEDELSVSVRVAEKLRDTPETDITSEVLETIDLLLGMQYNQFILEEIKENFNRSTAPKRTGFDHNLPKNIF